jgi:FKBP-type peptidyl-prolyl cis-trans isomerase FklB
MMRILSLIFLTVLLSVNVRAQALKTANDTLSYSLGVLIGNNLKQGGYDNIDLDLFLTAFMATMKKEPTIFNTADCGTYVQKMASEVKMRQFESNKVAGDQFLAENKKKSGVIALENGIQYEVLREGNGPKPKVTDEVIVHYHGTLIDGTVFDSSVDRGESISFPLNGVIKGWTETLQLMPVGSKWRVYIPYNLAYGDRAAGPTIQPYSTLIFEIDLLGIK